MKLKPPKKKVILKKVKPFLTNAEWKFNYDVKINKMNLTIYFAKIWDGDIYCGLVYNDYLEQSHWGSKATTKCVLLFPVSHYGSETDMANVLSRIVPNIIRELKKDSLLKRLLFDIYVHDGMSFFERWNTKDPPVLRETYRCDRKWDMPYNVFLKIQQQL